MSYEQAVADLDALLTRDANAELTKLVQELLESSKPEVKAAACHAAAKIRLKAELRLHGSESRVFAPGEEALRLFREVHEKRGEASVLNTLAQAHLITGDVEHAVSRAKEAARLAAGFQDKSIAAAIQDTLCQAYAAQGSRSKALAAAKEHVALLETIGSQEEPALRARIEALGKLAELQLSQGLKEASMTNAEKMTALCDQLGDKEKQAAAKRTLSLALVQSGKAEEAPNRAEAMAALERMMAAIECRSPGDFKKWWHEVESLGGVTEKDIAASLDKIREHHREGKGVDDFLREVGAPFLEKGTKQTISQFSKRHFYLAMRSGGIQYGPRYQCVTPYRSGQAGGKSIAALQPSSQSEQWEMHIGYHTGILDGCLQSIAIIGSETVW